MSRADTHSVLAGKTVLIVSPGVPHPTEGASTVLFYQYIRGIADAGARVLNVLLTDATNRNEKLLSEYLRAMVDVPTFDAVDCVVDPFYRLNRWTRRPRVQRLPPEIVDRAKTLQPDVVVCLDLLCAAYAIQLAPPSTRVVWLGDLNFQTFWYNAVYDVRDRWQSAVRLPLVALGCVQWRRFYRSTLSDTRNIIVSSKASEGALQAMGLKAMYLPYPWPAKMDTGEMVEKPARPTFVFFGSLSGLGSRSAFDKMINKIYPRLVSAWGPNGFRIRLAGTRKAPDWVRIAVADKPEIEFHGFVDDLVSFMRACHAVLVPIEVPVGNRSRILTAMAHRSLVVAHINTSAGNPDLVSGENCLLAKSPDEFVRHLRFAVENTSAACRIAERGHETYRQLFSPRQAVDRFIEVLLGGFAPRRRVAGQV